MVNKFIELSQVHSTALIECISGHKLIFLGGKACGQLLTDVQVRCFHVSPLTAAAAKVAMSKFDASAYLPYENLVKNLEVVKKRLGRPLTLSEKVLYSHIDEPAAQVSVVFIDKNLLSAVM